MANQLLTVSGTWTPPANVTKYDIEGVGGGSGGGRGSATQRGGQGGSSAYVKSTGLSCTPGVGIPFTCGAGGAGGSASPTNGGAGTDSNWNTGTLVADGSPAGGLVGGVGAPGAEGTAGTIINSTGQTELPGNVGNTVAGRGGDSPGPSAPFNSQGGAQGTPGVDGNNYGSGGGAGMPSTNNGGAGAPGAWRVLYTANPTALNRLARTKNTLNLGWTASPDATGYRTRINGGPATDRGNVTSYNFTNLSPNTQYTFEVQPYSADANGDWVTLVDTTAANEAGVTTKKYYFASSIASDVNPPLNANGHWTTVASMLRGKLSPTKLNTVIASAGFNEVVSGLVRAGIRQHTGVIDMPAGNYNITWRLVTFSSESVAGAAMFLDAVINLIKASDLTVKQNLYPGQTATVASATPTDPNYEFAPTPTVSSRILSGSINGVVIDGTEYLSVETGYSDNNSNTTGRTGSNRYGDPNANTEAVYEVDRTSTTEIPYLEITYTLATTGSTATNFIQRVREDAATFLGIDLNAVSISTNTLLHQYWAAKSGLSNPKRFSIQDHVLVAGKKHWLKDVTYN
jgi:hypothetical protein